MKLSRRVLHLVAKPCDFEWPFQNSQLADQLLLTMLEQKGIGLAAPQVGIRKRVFVMKIDDQEWRCFNPKIISASTEQTVLDEGCLSFPGESCIITRPANIQVEYQNADGTLVTQSLQGWPARCFQHELDHLDGIVMQDRYKEQNAKQS
jgi:peptide deformylase